MNKEQELRKKFQEYIEAGVWQGELEYTKNFAVGNILDFFMSTRKSELEEIVQKLESKLHEAKTTAQFMKTDKYNKGIWDAISIIKDHMK